MLHLSSTAGTTPIAGGALADRWDGTPLDSRRASVMSAAPRVVVRHVEGEDRHRPLPWLAEAVAAIAGRGTPPEEIHTLDGLCIAWDRRYPSGATLLGTLADGEPLGVMRLRERLDGRLVIDALAVRADQRNLGYGQELVIVAEEQHGDATALAAAGVPRNNGLAVYFWLRAGYRPAFPDTDRLAAVLGPQRLWMTRPLP